MQAVLFRCDGGPELGVGHLVRCKALAAGFAALGWRCAFAVTRETSVFMKDLPTIIVPSGRNGAGAVADAGRAGGFDSLVVDHYGLDAGFETEARGAANVVVAIDDLADRRHDCDILLDCNPERTAAEYRPLVGAHTWLLLGLKYALLRAEFAMGLPAAEKAPGRPARSMIVLVGGADPGRASELVLQALDFLRGTEKMQVTLVVGPANPRREALFDMACAAGAHAVSDPADLVDLMKTADLAITTGSGSCLELACLGIPTLILETAANQRDLARAVSNAGAGLLLGESGKLGPRELAGAVTALAGDAVLRASMREAGMKLVDGLGASRAAALIADMVTAKQQEMH